MKKAATLVLILVMTVFTFAACGGADQGGQTGADFSADSLKTFGDAIALGSEKVQTSASEDTFIYVFDVDGVFYRATGAIDQALSDEIFNLEYDDDYDENLSKLVSSVKIDKVENLSDQIISQEELDKLVGKTHQDLIDAGWYTQGCDLETMEFWMGYGPFLYKVTLDGHVDEEDYMTFNEDEDAKDMKILSAEFMDIGDATDID